jgi:hypothetical protein
VLASELNSLRSVEAKSIHAPNRKPELAEFETETEPEFDSKKVNIPSASLPVNQKQDGPSKQRIQVYWQSRPHPEKKKQSTVAASLLVRPNKKKFNLAEKKSQSANTEQHVALLVRCTYMKRRTTRLQDLCLQHM